MKQYTVPLITESDKRLPFYLISICRNWVQEHVLCPEGYYFQWIQCIRGEGEFISLGKTYRVKEGDGMLLIKGIPHEYYPISEEWIVDWIVFEGYAVPTFLNEIGSLNTSCVLQLDSPSALTPLIQSMIELENSSEKNKSLHSSSLVYTLLTALIRHRVSASNQLLNKHNLRIEPVIRYINHNYGSLITLDRLAEIAMITPQHLCTLFKKSMNTTLMHYINSVRIQKSKELLLSSPSLSIKKIAEIVGFEDTNYFGIVFKRQERISPNQYRLLQGRSSQ